MRAVTATPEHSRAWRASRRLPRPRRAQPSEDHADEPQRHGHDVAADPVTGAHVTVGAGAPCGAEEIADLVGAWDGDECGRVKRRLRALVHEKAAAVHRHLAEQAAFADQLRATADALAGRPVDGPCDDSCGCTTARTAERTDAGCGPDCCDTAPATGVPLARPGVGQDDAVPVACSLPGSEIGARIEDWRRALGDVTGRQPLPGGLRLELGAGASLADLAPLIEAERACCPFVSFAITVDERGTALEVTAPAEGQGLLAEVFGVAG